MVHFSWFPGSKKALSQMCGSKNPTVPDVVLQKRKCPRCVVERFRMMQLSQMSCSEHFQKGNCPRCVVQKHPLSQMCASIKSAVPDVMLQNRYCPRCHVLNIPKKRDIDVLVLVWNITSGTVFNFCFGTSHLGHWRFSFSLEHHIWDSVLVLVFGTPHLGHSRFS